MTTRQIDKIESIAERKIDEIQRIEYNKYYHIFQLAVKLIKKHRVLMYGGTAINELMPKSLKFYSEMELPDIDVFAVNAKSVAQHMVKEYKKRGFEFASFREALHENTFKVFVEGIQVLDITDVSESVYKRLSHGKVKGSMGLYLANPEYLRSTLHDMMAHPWDAYRWPKVYKRLMYFYKVMPMQKCSKLPEAVTKQHIPQEAQDAFMKWSQEGEFVHFSGPEVDKAYFDVIYREDRDVIITGNKNVKEHAEECINKMPHEIRSNFSISKVYAADDLFAFDHVFIMYKNHKAFGLYKYNHCVSYVTLADIRIASYQAMCYIYQSMQFSSHKHHKTQLIKCIIKLLGNIQLKIMDSATKPSKKKILNQFVLTCYGPYEGLVTLRRKQMERMFEKKNA